MLDDTFTTLGNCLVESCSGVWRAGVCSNRAYIPRCTRQTAQSVPLLTRQGGGLYVNDTTRRFLPRLFYCRVSDVSTTPWSRALSLGCKADGKVS